MSKNSSLEDIAKVSRRKALTLLGGIGASLLIPGVAKAELDCNDYQDSTGFYRTCRAGIDSSVIYRNSILSDELKTTQEKSMWCWAACIEMVFNYWGYEVPQEKIVKDTWGSAVNFPASPSTILRNLNKDWTDEDGDKFNAFGDSYSANVVTAAHDLADDKPLIIGTRGHAMVLTDLVYTGQINPYTGTAFRGRTDSAIVLDPWPGKGKRRLNASEWNRINFVARIGISPDKRELF